MTRSARLFSNDLTVTTLTAPNEGAMVMAVGVLHKDRNFGAGYRYELFIKDADLKP